MAPSRTSVVTNMSHLNGFFSSWTDAVCVFICFFRKKNCSHKCHIWMGFFYFIDRHMRPKQVNCHSVHHGWTIFVFNNQHCILIRSINHFGGRWNVVALWPLLYTNCPTALPWLSAAGCVRAHPAQCDAQVKCGQLISEICSILNIYFFGPLYDRNSDYEIKPNHFKMVFIVIYTSSK